jgi:NhaA family Na+:H+ antiporter
MEAAGGIVLVVAAAAALVWANVAATGLYGGFWSLELRLGLGSASVTEDLRHWVNEALMAVFFFVVGLEIKRELVLGELRDRRAAALPALAAVGGAVLPALLFLAIVGGGPEAGGWGIPMATDIAFAVGVLAGRSGGRAGAGRADAALRRDCGLAVRGGWGGRLVGSVRVGGSRDHRGGCAGTADADR